MPLLANQALSMLGFTVHITAVDRHHAATQSHRSGALGSRAGARLNHASGLGARQQGVVDAKHHIGNRARTRVSGWAR